MAEDIQGGMSSNNWGIDARVWYVSFVDGSAMIADINKAGGAGGGTIRASSKDFYIRAVRSSK
jgi:hypothetical protein